MPPGAEGAWRHHVACSQGMLRETRTREDQPRPTRAVKSSRCVTKSLPPILQNVLKLKIVRTIFRHLSEFRDKIVKFRQLLMNIGAKNDEFHGIFVKF